MDLVSLGPHSPTPAVWRCFPDSQTDAPLAGVGPASDARVPCVSLGLPSNRRGHAQNTDSGPPTGSASGIHGLSTNHNSYFGTYCILARWPRARCCSNENWQTRYPRRTSGSGVCSSPPRPGPGVGRHRNLGANRRYGAPDHPWRSARTRGAPRRRFPDSRTGWQAQEAYPLPSPVGRRAEKISWVSDAR